MSPSSDPFTILSLDGGGMRGLYTASVLRVLADRFRRKREEALTPTGSLDIGAGFDLVVGTSTGALLAAGIVAGVPLERICDLFRQSGPRIFKRPVPAGGSFLFFRKVCWLLSHLPRQAAQETELQSALEALLHDETFGQVYERRGIGLCISATDLQTCRPRVFKTPHDSDKDLDNDMKLRDACMASSAAPVYLPIASVAESTGGLRCYADGGLWANNPTVVGLLEGMTLASLGQPIVVLSVGTCPPSSGHKWAKRRAVGVWHWMSDVRLLHLAMTSQTTAAQYAAEILATSMCELGRKVTVLRCNETSASEEQAPLLQLDSTSPDAIELMANLGEQDATMTYRWTHTPRRRRQGELLKLIFGRMPPISIADHHRGEKNDRL